MPDFSLPDDLAALEEAARRLGERELAPRARDAERARRWPDAVLRVLDDFELGGLDLPATLGGVDAGATAKVVVLEALATGDPGGLPAADRPGPAAGALLACPDRSAAAEVARACLGAAALAALVVRDDETAPPARVEWAPAWPPLRWAWVSAGDRLDLVAVAAGAATEGRALGFHAAGCVTAALDGSPTVGTWELAPGAAQNLRGRARLWSAAVAVGIAQAAFDATIAYTTERVVFGRPVAHHQGNAFDLAAAATDLHAARLSVRDAAARFDAGDPHAGFWATLAWRGAVDTAVRVTDLGVQLLGGHGFLVDHVAEKRFREARMLALLHGGRDAADADVAAQVLDVPDPLLGLGVGAP